MLSGTERFMLIAEMRDMSTATDTSCIAFSRLRAKRLQRED